MFLCHGLRSEEEMSEEESVKPAEEETSKESASDAYLQVQPETPMMVKAEETCGRQIRD